MKVTDLFESHTINLNEGVNDPHIFKAVFMAGSPGAGKSTVAAKLLSHTGLKVIDVDKFEDFYRKTGRISQASDEDYSKFKNLASKQLKTYVDGRLGLIVDGTARNITANIIPTKEFLERLGYDTLMLFVNTDLQTSLDRAETRGQTTGRKIDPKLVEDYWKLVQSNLGKLQNIFHGNFYLIDNSIDGFDVSYVDKSIQKWLDTPPHSNAARQWIRQQQGAA
jgi:shikimate kinase